MMAAAEGPLTPGPWSEAGRGFVGGAWVGTGLAIAWGSRLQPCASSLARCSRSRHRWAQWVPWGRQAEVGDWYPRGTASLDGGIRRGRAKTSGASEHTRGGHGAVPLQVGSLTWGRSHEYVCVSTGVHVGVCESVHACV